MLKPLLTWLAGAAVLLVVTGCGSGATQPSPGPSPTPMSVGAACASELRDEFVRQQALVVWDVYCPSQLPDGFRLARAGDSRAMPYLSQDYWPTIDDLNPGGGTFITRLTAGGGRDLMIIQGAGASIFARHTAAGPPETPAAAAAFGDLPGSLYTADSPGVIAFDPRGYGHMVDGYGVASDDVATVAAAMRPVDPSRLRTILFSPADLLDAAGGWVASWPPDPTGEDVRNPAVCQQRADPGVRAAEAVAKFERANQPGAPADAGGHGPFLQQAVLRFGDEGAAKAYVDGVIALLDPCPKTWTGADSGVSYTLSPEMAPVYGDEVATFRRVMRSPAQAATTDVVMVRVSDVVSVVLLWQTAAAGADVPAFNLWAYGRLAAEKMSALSVTPTPAPTRQAIATPRPAPPATGIAEVDAVVRATLAGDADALVGMLGYTRMGCVVPQQEGSPPGCLPGEAPGTVVDSFPVGGCGGTNERAEDIPRIVRNQLTKPAELYSVFRPSGHDADYRLVFDLAGVFERSGFIFDLKGGRITGLFSTCLTVVDATRYVSEFIIWPPSGPHVQAAGHLKEFSIAQFVPTPYNTFIVTGIFDRTIDEVGATDPFAWSVPASLVYDGGVDRWWRVYWHRGKVFDCSQNCSVALAEADADARLKALRSGDPVCIIGWTDDVGNVDAELVYLHPPERCTPPEGFFTGP